MAKGLAYTLGKHWKLTATAVIAVITVSCWPERSTPPTASPAAANTAAEPNCLEDKAMLAAYNQHIEKNEHWKASRTIAICAAKTGDPDLTAKVREAEAVSREQDATDIKATPDARLQAIEKLRELDPQRADKLQPLVPKLEAAAKKAEAEAIKRQLAEKKKQGVRIGMTPEEVIQSMWGKPEKINRTTSAHGVREQWVYGGGNYLYFSNGKLETIQN